MINLRTLQLSHKVLDIVEGDEPFLFDIEQGVDIPSGALAEGIAEGLFVLGLEGSDDLDEVVWGLGDAGDVLVENSTEDVGDGVGKDVAVVYCVLQPGGVDLNVSLIVR